MIFYLFWSFPISVFGALFSVEGAEVAVDVADVCVVWVGVEHKRNGAIGMFLKANELSLLLKGFERCMLEEVESLLKTDSHDVLEFKHSAHYYIRHTKNYN